MKIIASFYDRTMNIIKQWNDLEFEEFEKKVKESSEIAQIANEVKSLCAKFPLNF